MNFGNVEDVRQGKYFEIEVKEKDEKKAKSLVCLLYTSDAADECSCVDLGGRRIIKKK